MTIKVLDWKTSSELETLDDAKNWLSKFKDDPYKVIFLGLGRGAGGVPYMYGEVQHEGKKVGACESDPRGGQFRIDMDSKDHMAEFERMADEYTDADTGERLVEGVYTFAGAAIEHSYEIDEIKKLCRHGIYRFDTLADGVSLVGVAGDSAGMKNGKGIEDYAKYAGSVEAAFSNDNCIVLNAVFADGDYQFEFGNKDIEQELR